MKENIKNKSVNVKIADSKITNKPIQDRDVTHKDIDKFSKAAVASIVKVLTSEDGYKVMKELSKR